MTIVGPIVPFLWKISDIEHEEAGVTYWNVGGSFLALLVSSLAILLELWME